MAASLPAVDKTQQFKPGDILVSNIRIYFKKIWRANCKGGCSNDVLVFRAKENINPEFLYYVLSDDAFFAYSTATQKDGTKMPRGDKDVIMRYQLELPSLDTQRKISSILSSLDDKIELNDRINANLEGQAKAIFKSWFVDFEPFGGMMPETWKYGAFGSIADISSGKRPPMKASEATEETKIPLVGASAIMGYVNKANYEEKILIIGRVGTHGIVQRFNSPCWASDNTLVIKSPYYEYSYQILQRIDYSVLNVGSTQPLITQGDLNKTKILLPDKQALCRYESVVGTLMKERENNIAENEKLASLRDALLPRLLSGELEVSELNI